MVVCRLTFFPGPERYSGEPPSGGRSHKRSQGPKGAGHGSCLQARRGLLVALLSSFPERMLILLTEENRQGAFSAAVSLFRLAVARSEAFVCRDAAEILSVQSSL